MKKTEIQWRQRSSEDKVIFPRSLRKWGLSLSGPPFSFFSDGSLHSKTTFCGSWSPSSSASPTPSPSSSSAPASSPGEVSTDFYFPQSPPASTLPQIRITDIVVSSVGQSSKLPTLGPLGPGLITSWPQYWIPAFYTSSLPGFAPNYKPTSAPIWSFSSHFSSYLSYLCSTKLPNLLKWCQKLCPPGPFLLLKRRQAGLSEPKATPWLLLSRYPILLRLL